MRFNCHNKFLFFQEIFSYFQIRYFLSIPVYNGQSRSRSYNFILAHFLNLEGPFRWVMVFLTSIDPLKSMITVRRKVILFHQNDDIVHFKSFQSLIRITYASHGNDFLPLNLDHGQTYRYRQVCIKETSNNFNKCIKHKVSAIPYFHYNGDKEKLTEHNSAVEANASSKAGISSEVKISLSFQRWNVNMTTR